MFLDIVNSQSKLCPKQKAIKALIYFMPLVPSGMKWINKAANFARLTRKTLTNFFKVDDWNIQSYNIMLSRADTHEIFLRNWTNSNVMCTIKKLVITFAFSSALYQFNTERNCFIHAFYDRYPVHSQCASRYQLSLKNTTPLLNLQTVQAPFLGNLPVHIGFSWTPPLKVGFFKERPKY